MADNFASFRDPNTGQAVLSPVDKAPVGVPYYQSAGIDPKTGMSTQGDVFNPFRGYVSPEGGGFGTKNDRSSFESLSGVSADKLGDTSGYTPEQWAQVNKTFAGIANGDAKTTAQAASSDNPFIRDTARAYLSGRGSQGFDQATWDAYAKQNPNWNGDSATPTKSAPMPNDPFSPFVGTGGDMPPQPTPQDGLTIPPTQPGVQFTPSIAYLKGIGGKIGGPTDVNGNQPVDRSTDSPFNTDVPIGGEWSSSQYEAGGMPATSPMGMTARGGYPGMQGRRYAMAGLNRFRKPGAGGPQFGVQQQGMLGGAGGAGASY